MKEVVLSVGGSLINPGEINLNFLKELKSLIKSSKSNFILICGGGRPARDYINAARSFGTNNVGCDEVGIRATLLNAELVRHFFKSGKVQQAPKKVSGKIVVAGGWRPGCSTDYDAVLWAKKNNTKVVINLSNTDFVYDKDPKKFKDAVPLKSLNWRAYRASISGKWSAGFSSPFDPVASKLADKLKLKVFIINGSKLSEISNALEGKPFIGSVIE